MVFPIERAAEVVRGWRDCADVAPDELSSACVAGDRAGGAPLSQTIIFRIGQAVGAVPDDASAFSHRDAQYLLHPISVWSDPADDERMVTANRAFVVAMRPYITGASYLNFTHEGDRVREAYREEKYARLVALKDTYDPTNLFRLNHNIRPSRRAAEPAVA